MTSIPLFCKHVFYKSKLGINTFQLFRLIEKHHLGKIRVVIFCRQMRGRVLKGCRKI